MRTLAHVQREFIDALLAETPSGDERFEIYRRNSAANRQGALDAAYPVLRRLVGNAFFGELSERFAREHPSRSGDLHAFGAELASFLARYSPVAALDYLPDVAHLEWAVHESFGAADPDAFDFDALGRVASHSYGELRFRLHPAARLLESPHPVVAIWEANLPGRDGTPGREEGPDRVLVMRENFQARPRRLAHEDWIVLRAFAAGDTLAAACDALGEAAAHVQTALARYASEGVIRGFDAT